MTTFSQNKFLFVLYLRLLILFSFSSQYDNCQEYTHCFDCGIFHISCTYTDNGCVSLNLDEYTINAWKHFDYAESQCSSFFNAEDQERYCGEIYQVNSTNFEFRMPSYDNGIYGKEGLLCKYIIKKEKLKKNKLFVSFYECVAYVIRTNDGNAGFSYIAHDSIIYDIGKLELIIYLKEPLTYQPLDIIIYLENKESSIDNEIGETVGIMVGCIVVPLLFAGLILLYCLCWKRDESSETFTYVKKKYKFKPINHITPEQRVVHNEESTFN